MWKMVQIVNNQHGVVMLVSLLVMALLTLVGMSALSTSDVELAIAANTKANKMAYYNGEAGLEYTRGVLQNSLDEDLYTNPDGDDLDLEDIADGDEDTYITATYNSPDNFDFTTTVTVSGTYPGNIFEITSVGNGPDNAETTIVASFVREMESESGPGAFGDELVEMKGGSSVYSYNSCDGDNPVEDESTGEASIGSNGEVKMYNGSTVDGDVILGMDDFGTSADLTRTSGTTINGEAGILLDEAAPSDPLEILSSSVFTFMADDANNDNDLIPSSALVGTDLTISGTVTLTSGNYYFSSIDFTYGGILNIDTSSGGEVNIYLTGTMSTANSAAINTTGTPKEFSIFSNSDLPITFNYSTDFKGLLYAPLATVSFNQGGDFYGAVIGNQLIFHNDVDVFADKCLDTSVDKPKEPSRLTQLWWKEVRN